MRKRILSILLCCVMLVGLLPAAAYAESGSTNTNKAIQLGINGISGYDSTTGYDYIYYGTWKNNPIQWRVLDDKANTGENGLFLLSDKLLASGVAYAEHLPAERAWQNSKAQAWCKDFAGEKGSEVPDAFTAGELGAILNTVKTDEYFQSSIGNKFDSSEKILNGDKVFFLSAEEAEKADFGFANETARIAMPNSDTAKTWWLRSISQYRRIPGIINEEGENGEGLDTAHTRPAFNLNESFVVLASAAQGGKNASGMGNGLASITDYTGNEWKLTVKDEGRNGFSATLKSRDDSTVTVSYSGAAFGKNEYISAMVTNRKSLKYYGRIAAVSDESKTSGEVIITLPDGFNTENGDKLSVFNEQCNGDYQTDYASEPIGILTPPAYTVTLHTNEGTIADGKNVTAYTYSEGATLPAAEDMTYIGHTFMGWYDNEGLTGSPVAAISDVERDNKEYWAKWMTNTYTVTLNTNGGTIADGKNVTAYTYGKGAALPTAKDMTYTGYTFKGWYDNEGLTDSPVTAISSTEIGNKEYWAKWEKTTYTPAAQKPEITIIGSGKVTLSTDGRTATIAAEEGYELASITLNGKEIANTDKLTGLKTGDKVVVTFRETSDESAAEIKAVAAKVGKMQLIARSSRTAKKNIRITVKTDKKINSLIKEIKDLGYTVKYKYYRSIKKSSKYGAKVEKDASSSSYINTAGKKGTRYYYKVRLMVYDAKGSLVAKTELKQCKYAARIWNK